MMVITNTDIIIICDHFCIIVMEHRSIIVDYFMFCSYWYFLFIAEHAAARQRIRVSSCGKSSKTRECHILTLASLFQDGIGHYQPHRAMQNHGWRFLRETHLNEERIMKLFFKIPLTTHSIYSIFSTLIVWFCTKILLIISQRKSSKNFSKVSFLVIPWSC